MEPSVVLATASGAWERDQDAAALLAALDALGVRASPAVWDDERSRWDTADLVVVRSTWDYSSRREEFLAWARATESVTRLANPAAVLEWNTDKRYLTDLDGARELVRRISRTGRTSMVQPYVDSVDEIGETGLVYFEGTLSHAFNKGPLLGVGRDALSALSAPESIGPQQPDQDQIALADHVLEHVADRFAQVPLYARVDILRADDGSPVLLELELTEPSWFLGTDAGSPERAARAIARCAAGPRED